MLFETIGFTIAVVAVVLVLIIYPILMLYISVAFSGWNWRRDWIQYFVIAVVECFGFYLLFIMFPEAPFILVPR